MGAASSRGNTGRTTGGWDRRLGLAVGTGGWDWRLGLAVGTGCWDWRLGLAVGTGGWDWQFGPLCPHVGEATRAHGHAELSRVALLRRENPILFDPSVSSRVRVILGTASCGGGDGSGPSSASEARQLRTDATQQRNRTASQSEPNNKTVRTEQHVWPKQPRTTQHRTPWGARNFT